MERFSLIDIADVNREIVKVDSFRELISVAELDGDLERHTRANPDERMHLNALLLGLITQGEAKVSIDYTAYDIAPGSFLTILPAHSIYVGKTSPDFRGQLLIITHAFLEECNLIKQRISMLHYMQIRKAPCLLLEPDERRLLEGYYRAIRRKIREQDHFFHKEVIQNTVEGMFLEVGNLMAKRLGPLGTPQLTRREELFDQFLQLLFAHCTREHAVAFYADKLCISPQYLSLILKELTGKSANKWIDDALLIEAKKLLKAPQATVQQVADALHFSDQSTFGKFFKKHIGISPMEYRKSN